MKAIIPAAGKGTRLLPNTLGAPKELITFLGKPSIEWAIDYLKENNINDITIITGYKKSALFDYLGTGSFFNVKIDYALQHNPKGLGHAILCAKNNILEDDFIVYLGDTIIVPKNNPFGKSHDLEELVKLHLEKNAFATMLLEEVLNPEIYGVVRFDKKSKLITDIYEKPKDEKVKKRFRLKNGKYLAISGIYVFNKEIFDYLKKLKPGLNNEIQLTDAILNALKDENIVYGRILNGMRVDIGNFNYLKHEQEIYGMLKNEQLEAWINERESLGKKIKREVYNEK